MGNVTVERNVYFGTSAQLKGEEENLPASDSDVTVPLGLFCFCLDRDRSL